MVTFDRSIPELAKALKSLGIDISANSGVFVRDMRGRLVFVSRTELGTELTEKVEASIAPDLRPYISPIGAVADQNTPGTSRALKATEGLSVQIEMDGPAPVAVIVLDRRATGVDWIRAPDDLQIDTPRLVFSSLKGGVGRSTALSVLAAELANRGRSILVLDLDLEAPGLGSMLIENSATPKFGSIDYYVEGALRDLDDDFFYDSIGFSWLGGGRGRIDVVPSFGAMSLANSREVLGKLARAYLESEDKDGEPLSFLKRTQALVERLAGMRRYDAILVDARSGLHETTAASILGLGADVLLFGVHQPQTFIGYRILLANLAQLPVLDPEHDWRYRLRMVHAKAESSEMIASFQNQMFDLFDSTFYTTSAGSSVDILEQGFRFGVDDTVAPHYPIPILEDERYRLFDPVHNREQLAKELYDASFAPFVQFCVERLQLDEDVA